MNFLSSIFSGIGNAATSAYNTVSNLFKGSSQTSNALQGTYIPGSLNAAQQNANNRTATDLGVVNKSTPNLSIGAQIINGTAVPSGLSSRYGVTPPKSLSAIQTPYSDAVREAQQFAVTAGQSRPLTPTQPTATNTQSSADVGSPFYNAAGNLVVPKVAFSGDSGASSGQDFNYTPPPLGAPGTAGGSSKTGLLNAAGGLYTPSIPFSSPLDENNAEAKKKQQQQGNSAFSNVAQSLFPQGLSINPDGTLGGFTPLTPKDNLNAALAKPAPAQPLQTSPVSASIDVAGHQNTAAANTKFTNNSYATSADDHITNLADQANAFDQNYQQETAKNPPNPNSISNTQEQADLINNSSDPFGVKQAMDSFIASQTQLPQLQASRVDLMNKINAANSTYQKIFDDIKENPDLPKGLSARRLEYQAKNQKPIIDGFVSQLNVVNQQIQDQNEVINRNFQIVQYASNQADKARDNARADLKLYMDTGTIGAFSAKDIQNFAASTGISASVIQKMKANAVNPNIKSELTGDATSGHYLVTFDAKTGQLIKKTQVSAPKVDASAAVGSPYAASLYDQVKSRSVDFNTLPADTKKQVLAEFGSRGETIPRPLTPKEKAASEDAISALGSVDDIEKLLKENKGALATNYFLGDAISGRVFGNSQLVNAIKEATDVKTRIRTGAALNASEISYYGSQAPAYGDSDADVKMKLNQLRGFYLGMSGVPVTVVSPDGKNATSFDDLYAPKQRLGLRKAITDGYKLIY